MTLPFFLAVALKGAVVLALAGLASLLLRRAPASARHGVWAAAFCGLLLLPVLEAIGPRWDVSVLPASASPLWASVPAPSAPMALPAPPTPPAPPAPPAPVIAFSSEDALVLKRDVAAIEADVAAFEAEMAGFEAEMVGFEAEIEAAMAVEMEARAATLASEAAALATVAPSRLASTRSTPVLWLAGTWALGVLIVGLGWLSAFLSARRLVAMATPETDEEWAVLGERARRLSGLPDRVRLLRSDRLDVPIAWGYGRPAVVLPASADTWTTERREAVLLHEMAHLRRHDAWTQVLAQAAVALHWMNPLVWVGYRRFLDAREQACDDAVLQGGARPSAYAQHLVGVARSLKRDRLALAAVSPMARRVPLESRVCSILDDNRRRSSLGRPAFRSALGIALLLLLPLAALRPVAIAQPAPEAPPAVFVLNTGALSGDPDPTGDDTEAAAADLDAAEAEMDAALAEIEDAIEEMEATPEADLDLSDLMHDLEDLEIDIEDVDMDELQVALEGSVADALRDLGEVSEPLARLIQAKAEHDGEFCPEETLTALKQAGLEEAARVAIRDAFDDARRQVVEIRRERRPETASVPTIIVRAADLEAQLAAAEARRHAVSFTVRGSSPPLPVLPTRRADSTSVFDWNAVDRARKAAVRTHGAST